MKERSSNFELLRIFSMLLIMASHYMSHGIIDILADNKTQELQEITKENITKFIFEWKYNE